MKMVPDLLISWYHIEKIKTTTATTHGRFVYNARGRR